MNLVGAKSQMQEIFQPEKRAVHVLQSPRYLIALQLENLQVSELNKRLVFDGGNLVEVEIQVL